MLLYCLFGEKRGRIVGSRNTCHHSARQRHECIWDVLGMAIYRIEILPLGLYRTGEIIEFPIAGAMVKNSDSLTRPMTYQVAFLNITNGAIHGETCETTPGV